MTYCTNCGTQLSEDTKFCPRCGKHVNVNNQTFAYGNNLDETNSNHVIVHGYEETFAIDVKVKIYKDEVYVGEVAPASTFMVPVDRDCELKFKGSFRSAKVQIQKGVHSHVFLSFDRFTGSLKAYPSGDYNKEEIENIKRHKSSKATLWSIIICILLFILVFRGC